MDWDKDMSAEVRDTFYFFGSFKPAPRKEQRELEGFIAGRESDLTSKDLREMAAHFIEAADWLDRRADSE